MTKLPTALLAFNEMIAFGVLLTLHMRGVRVSDDVSLIGYDDTKLAGLSSVGLTNVEQDSARPAGITIRLALAGAEGSASSDEGPQLIVARRDGNAARPQSRRRPSSDRPVRVRVRQRAQRSPAIPPSTAISVPVTEPAAGSAR